MEQHNIDSRFKQGLENLNRQPSADAWARLQARMNEPQEAAEPEITAPQEKKEERRILMWWHYAAAAVVLLFISIGIFKNGTNLGGKTAPEIAVNQTEKTTSEVPQTTELPAQIPAETSPEKAIASVELPEQTAVKTSENAIKKAVKTPAEKSVESKFKAEAENALAVAKPKKKRAPIVDPEKLPVANSKPVQTEETMLANNTPINEQKVEPNEQVANVQNGFAGMAIEVIVKKDNAENAVAQQTAQEDKDSKLVSIFKQARNLKNGEKVDLQALGVNTDSKLAAGTRSLHQKFSKVLDI